MADFVEVASGGDVDVVRALFVEYKQSVGVDLWFGNEFDRELLRLPEPYVRPGGRLLLVRESGAAAGCGALRRIDARAAEMKRMWLRPRFRRKGLGHALAQALIDAAREDGYRAVRLETLSVMRQARELHASVGFVGVARAPEGAFPGSILVERKL